MGKVRGWIVERSGGLESRVRFGLRGLQSFIEGLGNVARRRMREGFQSSWDKQVGRFLFMYSTG